MSSTSTILTNSIMFGRNIDVRQLQLSLQLQVSLRDYVPVITKLRDENLNMPASLSKSGSFRPRNLNISSIVLKSDQD